jgi:hypothetical protein
MGGKMKRIAYKLEDFPREEGVVQASWLLSQVSALRQFLGKTDKQTFDSSFSKWRKLINSTRKETLTQHDAAKIVFIACYSKSGKSAIGKKFVDIKPIAIGSTCNQWMIALSDRFATGKATEDDREIFKVLNNILGLTPTLKQLETVLEGAKASGGKSVSLRTMQRDARQLKTKLSLSEPIPVPVLRRAVKRLVKS